MDDAERKLYVRIASAIRVEIEDGHLRPGDKLPPLAELAEQFHCSRATVREAISLLRGQGLIEVRHGDGSYVKSASVEMWMEPLDAAILLGEGQTRELIELLTAVLGGIVTCAAQRRHRLDVEELNRQLFDMECFDGPGEESMAAELKFYAFVASQIDNALLENAFRILQEALRSALRVLQQAESRHHVAIGVETCRRIVDAVLTGDDVRAREWIYRYGDKLATEVGELGRRRFQSD